MKILEPAREFFRHCEERIYAKGRACIGHYAGTRYSSIVSANSAKDVVKPLIAWEKSRSKILQPAEEIVRCYEERIYALKGAIQEQTRTIESISVVEDRKDEAVPVEECIVVKVEDDKNYHEQEKVELQLDVCEDKILAPDAETPHKEIESVRADRLDRRVSELEKENESLRAERDLRLGDLRRICTEVDQFLDVVEIFLDKPCCGKGKREGSSETTKRGSSNSGGKKTLKSNTDRNRAPLKGSFYRERTSVASRGIGGRSSSLRKMLMMGTLKRKYPDVERREVIVRKLVLPPGILPWRP
ncbi:hypothetical protein R1flu_009709 [Riccia fluitans]|uniref:Uncharacterized protein n=1 Tax=Riccia fluitans TaxID=41844 RepID=A0ABD1Z724_9MARC